MEISQEEYERLLRRKDSTELWVNLPGTPGQAALRIASSWNESNPSIMFRVEGYGRVTQQVEFRMSEIFGLLPALREFLERENAAH